MTENNGGMTDFPREGRPAFPVEEKGTDKPDESLPSKTDTTQTPAPGGEQIGADKKDAGADDGKGADEKDRGFADDPRWQQREGDWKQRFNDQEKRHVDELAKLRSDFDAKISGITTAKVDVPAVDAPTEVPAWFNGDADQWKSFETWNRGLVAKEAQALIDNREKGATEKQQAETKAVKDATDYFNTEAAAIEADKTLNPKGEKVDRNKLLKTALDNDLVDSKGRWNYRTAFKLMQGATVAAPATNNKDRKDLAGATVSGGKPDAKPSNVTTSDDFAKSGGRPW